MLSTDKGIDQIKKIGVVKLTKAIIVMWDKRIKILGGR